jgi:hypothetical protein
MFSLLALRANRANRIDKRTLSNSKVPPKNPAPIPTTVVVGIVTPCVGVWVGEEEVGVDEEEVDDDISF